MATKGRSSGGITLHRLLMVIILIAVLLGVAVISL